MFKKIGDPTPITSIIISGDDHLIDSLKTKSTMEDMIASIKKTPTIKSAKPIQTEKK